MNIFESIKAAVTTRQAAEHYGIECNRNGMARCPFHDDRTPSMKLDTRFHCFGCGADGDAIDFTAQLFGIGKYEAARMLSADLGITTDYHDPPRSSSPKVTPITEARSERQWLLHAADVLISYEKLLKDWRRRYAPPDQDSELHPLYVESLRQLDRISLLVDMALCTDEAERHALYLNFKEEVQRIEDRIADYRSQTGGGNAGHARGRAGYAHSDKEGRRPAVQAQLCDRAGERSAS